MDFDGLISLLVIVLHWRVALCLIASGTLAVSLVHAVPWLTGLQGIVIGALGLLPGAVWEAAAAKPIRASGAAAPETALSVAAASAIIAGAAWGAVSSTSMHSFAAGAVVLFVAARAWSWSAAKLKWGVTRERVFLATALAALSYPIAALVAHNAL